MIIIVRLITDSWVLKKDAKNNLGIDLIPINDVVESRCYSNCCWSS